LLWRDTSVVLAIAAVTTTFLRDTGCSRSNDRIHRRRLAVVLVANSSTPVRTISRTNTDSSARGDGSVFLVQQKRRLPAVDGTCESNDIGVTCCLKEATGLSETLLSGYGELVGMGLRMLSCWQWRPVLFCPTS
jgi:hypothetical protein